jgi:hypothetical protein
MKRKPVSSTYLKTITQCLQKFYFKYHTDKEPVMSGEARAFGVAVHEALEYMYTILSGTGKIPTEEDYNLVYKKFLESGIENNLADQSLYEEGRTMLKARLDNYDPNEKIVGLELKFGYPPGDPTVAVSTPGGTPLIGAIDKLVELDPSTLVVLDYKTSRTALTDAEATIDEQLSLYALVASILYPQYKNIIIVLDYLRLGPVISHRTEEQLVWFGKYVDTMYEYVDELTEEDIKPRLNEFCGWCDYRNYCSAYDKVIKDPDLLIKPLETYSTDEFIEEWSRFNNTRRIMDGYKRELSMHASNILHSTGEHQIVGKEHTLYKVQNSKVDYDAATVMDTIPKKDLPKLINVKKSLVDKYLLDHPEYANDINNTAKVSFASSFFKQKKTKKK